MAKYSITAPDGKKYDLEGPEGASDEEVIKQVLAKYPTANDPLGKDEIPFETPKEPEGFSLGEAYSKAVEKGGGYGIDPEAKDFIAGDRADMGAFAQGPLSLARKGIANAIDYGVTPFQALGYGTEALAEGADEFAIQSGLADLPSVFGIDQKILPGSAVMALGEAFPLGGIETGILPPGLGRKGSPDAIEAVETPTDLGVQRMAAADEAAYSALLREGSVEDIMKFFQERPDFSVDPAQVVDYVVARDKGADVESGITYGARGEIQNPMEAKLAQEAKDFKPSREPTPDDVWPSEETLRAREAELEARLQREADAFTAAKAEADAPVTPEVETPENVQQIVDHANELSGKWKNSPDIEVHPRFEGELDPNSLGLYDAETGKVMLNAEIIDRDAAILGITPQELTNTVLFHEGLGHYGLAQKFRQDLDATLDNWYENSRFFKRKVDNYLENDQSGYNGPDRITRAGEEVLAEMSESGQMPVTFVNKIKNQIKSYVRQLGLNLEFSAREIRTILAQSHEAVVNGTGYDVAGNGFRAMRSRFGESEGTLQGKAARVEGESDEPTVINAFRTNRPVEDLFEEFAPEKETQNWGDWASDAERIQMTDKAARNLASGAAVPELKAAEMHALKLANSISDMSKKAANQTLSPKEATLLRQWTHSFQEVNQAIADVVANAARILNSRKMEVATDQTLSQRLLRKMMSQMSAAEIEALATPEGAKAFSQRLTKETKKAERIEKSVQIMGNIMNFTRSIWSSYDLSAPFRQGRALAHTGEFWKNIPDMFKYWGNEAFYDATMKSIRERPTFKQMERAGLAFTEMGADLSKREEQFMSTWAEKIPGVKASGRAYNGYLNKLRADVFDRMLQNLDDTGVDFQRNPKIVKDLATFINNATGRGDLGRLNQAAPILSGVLFSPRLMASRVNMLNPWEYVKMEPAVRKEAIKSLIAFGTTSMMVAELAKMGGADVESDPRSSDFMKIKKGDTRYDMLGGFGQYLVLGARLATNQKKNAKGDIKTLGEGYGADDIFDVLSNFIRSKFSPNASLIADARAGENVIGEPFELKNEIGKRFVPLFFQDAYELMGEEGIAKGAAMSVPSLFGIGAQTYPGPQGTDTYGRSYEGEREDTPVTKELDRLGGVNSPRKKVEGRELSPEEFQEYQKLSGYWITELMKEEMAQPDWQNLSDEERKEIVKEVSRDARAAAREYLFTSELETGAKDEE